MDVHKPKLIKNWRELVKEWGIIVLGVLTALLAEQAVQALEWRHKVEAAIEDMAQELSNGDGPESYARLAMHDCVATRLSAIRTAIEQGDRQASRKAIETVWLPRRTYDSLARESAVASDVASHMSAEDMFNFRIAYSLVPELDRVQQKELADLSRLRALPETGGPVQQAEKLAELESVEALELDNDRMARAAGFTLHFLDELRIRLNANSLARNLREANVQYNGCLSPDLRARIAASI